MTNGDLPIQPCPQGQGGNGRFTAERYAKAYARLMPAFRPFPVVTNQKKPLRTGWQETVLDQAVAALAAAPMLNLGLAIPSGYLVLDIDIKNGNDGFATLRSLEDVHGELVATLTQSTPSGGEHRVFQLPDNVKVKSRVGIAPGLDTRCHGGYIVCEPSTIDGNRYEWIDFELEGEEAPLIAAAPQWLIDMCVDPEQQGGRLATFSSSDAIIGEGGRNDTLFRKACALRRQGLTEQEMAEAIHSMNTRLCDPPLPKAEVAALVHSAAKYDPYQDPAAAMPAWALPRPKPSVSGASAAPSSGLAVPHHLLTIPGKLGLMVEWANATAIKPQPYFAVQAALAFGSVLLGRKYRTKYNNWPSLYFLNIGVSACGKEHAKTVIEECLHASGLAKLIGAAEYTSDAAIDSLLLVKPTHISVLDEFGLILEAANNKSTNNGASARRRLLEVFGRAHATLQPKAYSTAGLTQRQREQLGSRVVEHPALTLLAMTTPTTFFDAVGTGSLRDGFLNRFIIVSTDIGRQVSRRIVHAPPPAGLIAWAKSRRIPGTGNLVEFGIDLPHDMRPDPTVIGVDEDADRVFDDFEVACLKRQNELEVHGASEMFGRAREIAMKVALVVSQSCESDCINQEHASWAIEYVRFWADHAVGELLAKVADNPFASLCKEIAALVQHAGLKGITESELSRKSAKFRGADKYQRSNVFANLASDHGILPRDLSGRGRPRLAYVKVAEPDEAD